MWKKDEQEEQEQEKRTATEGTGADTKKRPEPTTGAGAPGGPATIGPSITVDGDISGEEDLLIQGRVDGLVNLADQAVTVGKEGRVKADIVGRIVTVEGEVEGDLTADEQVILRSAARVEGDITAPRVVLEDGATFKGLVDMSRSSSSEGTKTGSGSGSDSGSSASRSGGAKPPKPSAGSGSSAAGDDDAAKGGSRTGKKEKAPS